MNKKQIQKHLAYRAGKEINETYNSVWSGDATYSNEVNTFNNNIASIENERNEQAADLTGFTVAKKQKKEQLAKKTARAAGNLVRYADVNNLTELLSNFAKLTDKKLLRMKDNAFIGVVSIVLEKIGNIGLPPLAAYNIDAGKVTEITTLKGEYIPMIGKPKALADMKKMHTFNLTTLFKTQDDFIKKQLLPGANNFTETSPDYVLALNNALTPEAAASIPLALRVLVQESPGHAALEGVKVEIMGTNITRFTSALGQCRIKNLVSGNYILRLTKTGYSPIDYPVIIDNTHTTDALILMAHT